MPRARLGLGCLARKCDAQTRSVQDGGVAEVDDFVRGVQRLLRPMEFDADDVLTSSALMMRVSPEVHRLDRRILAEKTDDLRYRRVPAKPAHRERGRADFAILPGPRHVLFRIDCARSFSGGTGEALKSGREIDALALCGRGKKKWKSGTYSKVCAKG